MAFSKNVQSYDYGSGSLEKLTERVNQRRGRGGARAAYFIDDFFSTSGLLDKIAIDPLDAIKFVSTVKEPTTWYVDQLTDEVRRNFGELPCCVVGIGGGSVIDISKAVSNLLNNGGRAENYQGWDLVQKPGIYKIAVPTLSGTGAETSRTCVMTNEEKNIKLGMNSQFSVVDHLILDPELSITVPRNQFFYTGMDTYIHCVESLEGQYRHVFADAFSEEALELCRRIFLDDDMQADKNRERMMVASYLGGAAIANTFVGLVHPLSAGLSSVLGFHHGISNCLIMQTMEDFYPMAQKEFQSFLKKQDIELPKNICRDLPEEKFREMYLATIVHEKPLINALGKDYKKILSYENFREMLASV